MRDDLVIVSTGRQLRSLGLAWYAQPGDWCMLLDGAHFGGEPAGIWLAIEADPQVGWVTVIGVGMRWPPARIAVQEALWLPTAGQLKSLLRGHGFEISTSEGEMRPQAAPTSGPLRGWAASILGTPNSVPAESSSLTIHHHHCVATRAHDHLRAEASGPTEAEAVGNVVAQILTQTTL